jgi:hypothetical protein
MNDIDITIRRVNNIDENVISIRFPRVTFFNFMADGSLSLASYLSRIDRPILIPSQQIPIPLELKEQNSAKKSKHDHLSPASQTTTATTVNFGLQSSVQLLF